MSLSEFRSYRLREKIATKANFADTAKAVALNKRESCSVKRQCTKKFKFVFQKLHKPKF